MLKKIIITLGVLVLSLSISSQAFAVYQIDNAEVPLGIYTDKSGTIYSKYCTATQSHINLRVDATGGSVVNTYLQYRGPNETWKTLGSGKTVYSRGSYTHNANAIKGYDYRVKITTIGSASGVIMCW